jgi:hypothetical protein
MLPINIGLDFGTSFSKICVRGPRSIGVEVCTFGKNLPEDALLPSKIWVTEDGAISLPFDGTNQPEGALIEYPKMALADLSSLRVTGATKELQTKIEKSIEPLCALYLAHALGLAKKWVRKNWEKYLGGEQVEWSANVGVPVEHLDSAAEDVFARVLAVAWRWTHADQLPTNIDQVKQYYSHTLKETDPEMSECQPFPEIGAAVQAFVSSQEARQGIYVFFDVGGGTLDGVAFNFRREDGLPIVDFYSGVVEPLGVQALSELIFKFLTYKGSGVELGEDPIARIAESLVSEEGFKIPQKTGIRKNINQLVAKVIMYAKRKDRRNWRSGRIQEQGGQRPYYYPVKDKDISPLVVFMGGGGCRSDFYCDAIASTYVSFNHHKADIPPYALTLVPKPRDVNLGDIDESVFHRFLIAYGLSVPFGEGADINLPKSIPDYEPPPPDPESPSRVKLEYENSKDMFD